MPDTHPSMDGAIGRHEAAYVSGLGVAYRAEEAEAGRSDPGGSSTRTAAAQPHRAFEHVDRDRVERRRGELAEADHSDVRVPADLRVPFRTTMGPTRLKHNDPEKVLAKTRPLPLRLPHPAFVNNSHCLSPRRSRSRRPPRLRRRPRSR